MAHALYENMATPALLNAEISASATTITLQAGQGALLGDAPTGGNYIWATLFHINQDVGGETEIVKITARSTDSLTVTRAQQGTTGKVFYYGDCIDIRITKDDLNNLGSHIDDATAAHAATAISNTPAGNIVATTVQAAIDELDTDKATTASVATAQATADNHIADATAAHAATAISNTPAGNIVATTVQAAIDELDTDKAALAGATFTGAINYKGASAVASNCGFGSGVLEANTTGSLCTAVGFEALKVNTEGYSNTSIGYRTLYANTTGNSNTAVGYSALVNNITAIQCTAVGLSALFNNNGSENTAVGYYALFNNLTATRNTAVGYQAAVNTTGLGNTAIGHNANFACTSGTYNTGIGQGALSAVTTGSNNIAIGLTAGAETVRTITTNSNEIVIGNNSHTAAYIKVAWTVTSDARDKTNFSPVPHGLSFVQQLQPVAYQYVTNRTEMIPTGNIRYGFTAQNILALEGDNPVIINNDDLDNLKYNESSLIPVLVKAIQELAAQVQELQARLGGI